jgi:hypothetical protein
MGSRNAKSAVQREQKGTISEGVVMKMNAMGSKQEDENRRRR